MREVTRVFWGCHVAQVFAAGQRRMRSAIWLAVASGTLVEYLPFRRAQCRRPVGCRISSMRCVRPSRFFRPIRMSVGSLCTNLPPKYCKSRLDGIMRRSAVQIGLYRYKYAANSTPLLTPMSEQELFLDSQHSVSRRFAVFEDDGTSAWLYLTESDTRKPVADAWVYNRIPAPPTEEVHSYRGGPPPAAIGHASDMALCAIPADHEWSLIWSTDGESVAIVKDGVPVACIVAAQESGYSRELIKDGPWGQTWSDELFERTFGYAATNQWTRAGMAVGWLRRRG